MSNLLTNADYYNAEEAIIHLSIALGISEKEAITILEAGITFEFAGNPPAKHLEFIDEMKASFDCY